MSIPADLVFWWKHISIVTFKKITALHIVQSSASTLTVRAVILSENETTLITGIVVLLYFPQRCKDTIFPENLIQIKYVSTKL